MNEPIENSKLDTAIGIWKIPFVNIEIEYTVKDLRKLKRIFFKKREDRSTLYDDMADYITEELVPKHTEDYSRVNLITEIELNIMKIVENVMLTFRFTTKEDMAKAEKQIIKNQMEMGS